MMPRIAAIVPAFNEEATIVDVVRPLATSGVLSELIVVSDGSTDQTVLRAHDAGATRVIVLPKNMGKGAAMRAGVAETSAEFVLFCDADLRGFTSEHVQQLVYPVLTGARDMNVGLRDRGWFWTKLSACLPLISGERALRRELFEAVPIECANGFMIETALNAVCRSRRARVGTVVMRGVSIRHKHEKVGWRVGFWQYVHMGMQILEARWRVRWARWKGRI